MKKLLFAGLFLFGAGFAFGANTFDADSGRVVVSTIVASPTQVFTAASWGRSFAHSSILNDSGFNLFLSTSSTGISTSTSTGNFYIPNSTVPFELGDYNGALWVVVGTTTPKAVGILRIK